MGIFALFAVLWTTLLVTSHAYVALPCCAIQASAASTLPLFFAVHSIHFVDPNHCSGVCIAKLRSKKDIITVETCVNGFNLRSFLVAVVRRLGSGASQENLRLLWYLQRSLAAYAVGFNETTANSSILIISVGKAMNRTGSVSGSQTRAKSSSRRAHAGQKGK
ncbi:ORF47 [Human gammaherpesvirus 8]|uniref:ORF47 n=1 Tax=Human herpesvirus 8 TaxID=37296 RepID=A0A193PN48_HHV8|nr:ORF47 [Human gammaherpesvirus 8]QKE51655.1 ORF47 [Human gammaherpesvirus 8]QLI55770.1 ORF47 [Human gammaherpesvirus 8]QLI55859.1 ORF47 [Human gammaherpesvirus 8]QLI55948.1 ORF47 [Human gammaherpesvirus 8]